MYLFLLRPPNMLKTLMSKKRRQRQVLSVAALLVKS